MSGRMDIINRIIPNAKAELPLLITHLEKLKIYEKGEGKWYIKSHDASGKERLILDEKKNQKRPRR
ncbi:hypothetical protein [Thermococcus sp. 21S7]|uniref:hypothetical protein n=1 Tax=Thermococcus sp. 21S7 TaxID=1638221 RepID=UPI00143B853A|nr:hypothetical protein [Thermococcus sp. 21S7]NJE61463.1 hypothetical protein [Thermococcus sp. 21S7]